MTVIEDEITLCARAAGMPLERVRELAHFAQDLKQPFIRLLVQKTAVDEEVVLRGLATELGLAYLGVEPKMIEASVLASVSPALAISHHIVPIDCIDGRLRLACSNPFNWQEWEELAQIIGSPIDRVLCPHGLIGRILKVSYGIGADTVQMLLAERSESQQRRETPERAPNAVDEEAANEPTVVNLVNQILVEAIRARASDIHFEPQETRYRIRYRIDGMLEDASMPASVSLLRLALVSRIKIMSNLDITEKRLPQDGRAQVRLTGQEYDLRISILPGVHGEAVSIRLQSRQMLKLDLEALGFCELDRRLIRNLVSRPHGLVLVTGPTGSGKTTTLYTCLNFVNTPTNKVVTIEDPVEYRMDDVLQMQVHEEIGFTFAAALRSILRHDPDVILVGEIRDRETADIAIRASLTGHLVFATLHTNDASSAFTRLIDLGIEPFLVASSVVGVVAQRLVRKICPGCSRPVPTPPGEAGPGAGVDLPGRNLAPREAAGCELCRFTGYCGRTVVSESLSVTSEIRRLVQSREPADRIKEQATKDGMRTLRENALDVVRRGQSTTDEVVRVTQEEF